MKSVFLIGDSIRLGYCGFAKEMLSDVAEVYYPEDNCRYVQYTYVGLQEWKGLVPDPNAVDVIVWNNGHWDVAHWDKEDDSFNTIEEYQRWLVRIAKKLRRYFPNAKIVFTTTLPVNPLPFPDWNEPRTSAEIRAYNDAAIEVLANEDVIIDDAFALFENEPPEFFADCCHPTAEGSRCYAEHLCTLIRTLL